MKNLYFDTEFTCLRKGTSLISIGIVTQDDKFFYAELTDYDEEQCDDFINNEIIDKTFFLSIPEDKRNEVLESLADGLDDDSVVMYGTRQEVSTVLNNWLSIFNDDIQFISDVEQYDMVVLIDLITDGATSRDLPAIITPDCININTFIAMREKCTVKEAFDMNREDMININTVKEILGVEEVMKHNSIWDAVVIKELCNKLKSAPGGNLLW